MAYPWVYQKVPNQTWQCQNSTDTILTLQLTLPKREILLWHNPAITTFFQKMIKLLLDKQIFASSDAKFCHDMRNDGHNTQNFDNFSLDMVLSP